MQELNHVLIMKREVTINLMGEQNGYITEYHAYNKAKGKHR
jgi:hypothetical protein